MIRSDLLVAYGPRGRGVYTLKPISKGDLVEIAPCVDLPNLQGMDQYTYKTEIPGVSRVAFGYAMLYAHSSTPNMNAIHDATCITFYAAHDIAAGDELTQDYGDEFWEPDAVIIKEKTGA